MVEAASKRTNVMPSGKYHTRSKIVKQFDLEGNFIKEFDSIHQDAKELSIQPNGICLCCKEKLKTSGGYIFRYGY